MPCVPLDTEQLVRLVEVTAAGGVVCFPADTVYGLAADPARGEAVGRLAALKGRDPGKPSALMLWSWADARRLLDGLPDAVLRAAGALLPGPVGLLVFDPRAGGGATRRGRDEHTTLGIRVPRLGPGARDLSAGLPAVVQTSANRAGAPDPATLDAVPAEIREACELVLDGGPLPGTASTIVDLRELATGGPWRIVREGALSRAVVTAALGAAGVTDGSAR